MSGAAPGRSLRIAFLDSWKVAPHEGSGTAVAIHGLATGLAGLGHQVEIVRPEASGSDDSADGLLAHRLHFNLEVEERLAHMEPVDLVVGFDLDGVFLDRRPHRPFVLCLKGVAGDELRFVAPQERLLLQTLARFEAMNARGAKRVVVPSLYSAERARESYGIPAERIHLVPESFDTKPWQAERTRLLGVERRPTILSVAHQYRRKDTATLVRAMARVREAVPGARLEVIGGGPELPTLHQLVSELGLQDSVDLRGPIPSAPRLRQAYRGALVFALPSLQEAFGIVFLEAMAAGLPVVAARAGAVPEVVEDGKTGILVPPGDAAGLAEALILLLQDPALRTRLGSAGQTGLAQYAPERVAARFLDVVLPTLSSPAPNA